MLFRSVAPQGTPQGPPASNPSASNHPVSLRAHCTPASAGGAIKVQAKVLHATRGKTFTATASASLLGGVVNVDLRRAGKSFVATGKIAVPAGQAAGDVTVTVTITYDGVVTVKTCTSTIHLAGPEAD